MTTKADKAEAEHLNEHAPAPAVDPNDDPLTRIEMNDPHPAGTRPAPQALAE